MVEIKMIEQENGTFLVTSTLRQETATSEPMAWDHAVATLVRLVGELGRQNKPFFPTPAPSKDLEERVKKLEKIYFKRVMQTPSKVKVDA